MAVPFDNSWRRHIWRTLELAGPVILARVGLIGMLTIDVIVLGRAGAEALAHYVLGQALYDSLIAALAGLLLGVSVLTARTVGAGEDVAAGQIWRRGLAYAFLVGGGLCFLLQFAEAVFLLTGQAPELAKRAAAVTGMLAFALPPMAAYIVSASFLEALSRPVIGMIAILIANGVNLLLNIALVFGAGPLPALGALGCAIATVITATALAAGMFVYVRYLFPDRTRYGVDRPAVGLWREAGEQRRIGYAAGLSYSLEAGAFMVMTLMVGLLGTLALAAYAVLFQFLGLIFMVAFGIAAATQVRVGNAWGRNDPIGMSRAGWTGLFVATVFSLIATGLILGFPDTSLGLFTTDRTVLEAARPILIWVALALVFDGGQSVMNQACRGRGDTWVPTALHFASYWLVMVPLAGILTFHFDHGVSGIYEGIVFSAVFSLSVLSLRFYALSRG